MPGEVNQPDPLPPEPEDPELRARLEELKAKVRAAELLKKADHLAAIKRITDAP